MITGGGLLGPKSLGRWTPCRTLLQRGFAQERRPTSNDDETLKDSAGGASQQAQQVKTTPQEIDTDSDSGEIPTPSLLKATSTKDFFISSRDQRLRQKERKDEEADEMKLQEPLTKGADLDSG